MSNLHKEIFICIDCETTGLDPKQDRIVEVGAAIFDAEKTYKEFSTLIDPECPIPESSTAIHRITQEMVQGKPKIHEVLPELLSMIGKHIIVGHGVKFDVDCLVFSAKRTKISCEIQYNRYLDTLRMARIYGESPTNSLEKLREHFRIDEEGAHRAMNDVLVNMNVFRNLIKHYKSLDHLFEVLSRPIFMKNMPLGKHKGRSMKEVPLQYLLWAANKDFDQDLIYSIRSELKRRKQGNQFDVSASPFSQLL